MEWLSELIKHITISRSFTGAVFITSGALVFGNWWWPDYFDPFPKEWAIPANGALIFSGTLLLFWIIPAVWRTSVNAIFWIPKRIRSRSLSPNEEGLIEILANLADEPLNLERLNYAAGVFSKLEVLELSAGLERKGLVEINPYDENLVKLSAEGRRRALLIKRGKMTFQNEA
jgi:hypothetical protein